jgi:hypothetical protein
MVTFTTARQLQLLANGEDVGTWDVPENSNWSVVDAALGQQATITCAGANITLSPSQYQCNFIVFVGNLTANIVISFPSSFRGPYTVYNICSNSVAFQIQLSCGVGPVVAAPPGQVVDVINNGGGFFYRNLEPIGTYVDIAGFSTPAWINFCTVPPYLFCDGSAFSAGTYPVLATMIGGTTLPDARGRTRYALDFGTGRTTGVIPNNLFQGGGDQWLMVHGHPVNIVSNIENQAHNHNFSTLAIIGFAPASGGLGGLVGATTQVTGNENQNHTHNINGNTDNNGAGTQQNMPPLYNGGITMIRAG